MDYSFPHSRTRAETMGGNKIKPREERERAGNKGGTRELLLETMRGGDRLLLIFRRRELRCRPELEEWTREVFDSRGGLRMRCDTVKGVKIVIKTNDMRLRLFTF